MDTVTWLKETFGLAYPPLRMCPEDIEGIVKDHERMNRHLPNVDSECSTARTMFLLRSYSGRRECFDVDTSTKRLTPLAFFEYYDGQHELFVDLNIHPLP